MTAKSSNEESLAIGMGLGVALGTALGVALDQLPIYLSLGIAIGAALGTTGVFAKSNKNDCTIKPEQPTKEEE